MSSTTILQRTKRSYSTVLKLAVWAGTCPENILRRISPSTLHGFRNMDVSKIFGLDFHGITERDIETFKLLIQCRKTLAVIRSLMDIHRTSCQVLIAAFNIPDKAYKVVTSQQLRAKVVSVIQKARNVLPLEKVLALFNLPTSVFLSWVNQIRYNCSHSPLARCFKVYPHQATDREIATMKRLASDDRFSGWPIASIAWHAVRNKLVSLSLSTWYKYANILGLKRTLPRHRRKDRAVNVRVNRPGELLHADITFFRTLDNGKYAIYLLIDNFSRFILSWRVSDKTSAALRFETIQEAFYRFDLGNDRSSHLVTLVTDGGPENFLPEHSLPIRQIIAQQDVSFSNSIIEAANKLIKYRYLYARDLPDRPALEKHLEQAIFDYNYSRPHLSLNGLTPFEAWSGKTFDKFSYHTQLELAKRARIAANSDRSCLRPVEYP